MAFYFYLSTKIIMVFITKSYQDLFGVRSYINAYDDENRNDCKRRIGLPDRRRTPRVFYPRSFPAQKETALSIRLPQCGRRIILLRRPDIGGVPSKTGYMVE